MNGTECRSCAETKTVTMGEKISNCNVGLIEIQKAIEALEFILFGKPVEDESEKREMMPGDFDGLIDVLSARIFSSNTKLRDIIERLR